MKDHNNAVDYVMDIYFRDIKSRMKELKIPQYKLAELIGVREQTLIRNFKKETDMSLRTYLKICEILNLND